MCNFYIIITDALVEEVLCVLMWKYVYNTMEQSMNYIPVNETFIVTGCFSEVEEEHQNCT